MPRNTRILLLGFVVAATLATGSEAVAQLSPDPYNPWNSQYDAYVYPSIPGGTGVYPGQAAYEVPNGNRGANRFSAEVIEPYDRASRDEGGPRVPLRRGVGVPYTRAFREYDQLYGRVYTPNAEADETYNKARQAREQAYSEWRAEKDPKARAERRAEYNRFNRELLREQLFGSRNSRTSGDRAGRAGSAVPGRGSSGAVPRRPRVLRAPTDDLGDEEVDDATPRRPSTSRGSASRLGSGREGALGGSSRSNARTPEDTLRRSRSMNRGGSSDSSGSRDIPARPRP
jgi:hypothetical protein